MNLLTIKTQLVVSKMKNTVFATSPTKEGIVKCLNQFYYSTTFTFNASTGEIFNSKGLVNGVEVVYKKGRYIFQSKVV